MPDGFDPPLRVGDSFQQAIYKRMIGFEHRASGGHLRASPDTPGSVSPNQPVHAANTSVPAQAVPPKHLSYIRVRILPKMLYFGIVMAAGLASCTPKPAATAPVSHVTGDLDGAGALPAVKQGQSMSSFRGGTPARPRLRMAVLGDSDSHAFHDAVSLHYGTPDARGGEHQASTWQWTEVLAQLRPEEIDQGPFGEVGASGAGAWLRRHLLGSLVRQHKEDFRYNVAFSGATCEALNDPAYGQVPVLLAEIAHDLQAWRSIPAVAVIRIGINSLGKRTDLDAYAASGADAANLGKVNACAEEVSQAVHKLRERVPFMDIVLVGILNNVDWPPLHGKYQSAQAQARIAGVLDAYDQRLRELARTMRGVHFFDDRAFFRHWFGSRDAQGRPAYREVKLGGDRAVTVSQGDEPWHAVIGDGHAGTIWNGLWAAAMVAEFNRIKGVDIAPVQFAEIARLADPDHQFGLRPR